MEANLTLKTTNSNQKPLCFILANGLTNGGVTTWAINASRRMVVKGQPCAIIAHEPEPGNDVFQEVIRIGLLNVLAMPVAAFPNQRRLQPLPAAMQVLAIPSCCPIGHGVPG